MLWVRTNFRGAAFLLEQIGMDVQKIWKTVETGGMMVWLLRKCVKCGEYTLSRKAAPLWR